MSALGETRRKFNHVALAQRVARIVHQVCGHLRVILPDVLVPGHVAVGDAHGLVHQSDGGHGADFHGVWVLAEGGCRD